MKTTLHAPDRNLDYQAVEESLVSQMRNYVTQEAKSKANILGLSGGVDSATVATLAAKTGLKTVLVTMPIHQAIDEVTRADKQIKELMETYPNVLHEHIDLTETYETLKNKLIESGLTEDELYMALVNTRSRLRMVTLYALGTAHNAIVQGTGNKVEDHGLGFFTKYGDGGVDYSSIGELTKSEVYKLGSHMGVIKEILEARPTDGLHPDGATDEDQIGATYDELERAMEKYDRLKQTLATDTQGQVTTESTNNFIDLHSGREREVMKIYLTRHIQNAHKMRMPEIATVPGV